MGACGKSHLAWTFMSRVWRQSGRAGVLEAKWGAGTAGGRLTREAELNEAKCDVFNKDRSQKDKVVLGS